MSPEDRKRLILLVADLNRNGLMRSTLGQLGALVIANPGDFGLDIETIPSQLDRLRGSTPWVDQGISRATWYRRRKTGTHQ